MRVEIRTGRGIVFLWMYLAFPEHPVWDDYCWHQRVHHDDG